MLNRFTAIGNLTKDPETRKVGEEKTVCKFSIAVNGRGKEEVLYVDVETWNRSAENCQRFLSKGRKVAVDGRLRLNTWQSKTGEKRSKLFCVADSVSFLDKADAQTQEGNEQGESEQETKKPDTEDDFDQIPF